MTNDPGGLLLVVILLGMYFFPTVIAVSRKKRSALAIFVLNFIAGWTILGWFGSLIWALTVDSPVPGGEI